MRFSEQIYEEANYFCRRALTPLSDEQFDSLVFYLKNKHKLNLVNPSTYTEKLLYIKRNDHDARMTLCADKYRVGDYLNSIGLGEIKKRIYSIYDDPSDIVLEDQPERFFIKCNHGSRGNHYIDKTRCEDFDAIKRELSRLLKRNYYWQAREWAYKNISPLVICEEALVSQTAVFPLDYKFYCFNGRVEYFMTSIGEYEHHSRNHKFGRDGRSVDYMFKKTPSVSVEEVPHPKNLNEMIEVAEQIAWGFRHVRVDLYNIDGRIVFGEMTFYSNGGFVDIPIKETEEYLGGLLDISDLPRLGKVRIDAD